MNIISAINTIINTKAKMSIKIIITIIVKIGITVLKSCELYKIFKISIPIFESLKVI